MSTLEIRDVGALAAAVPSLLGFYPANDLVIAGIGAGPTARISLDAAPFTGLSQAVRHWRADGVMALIYADAAVDVALLEVVRAALPGVQIHDIGIVVRDQPGVLSVALGRQFPIPDSSGNPELDARRIAASREAAAAETEATVDADEALDVAMAAWQAGDGARAYMFLDRARALGLTDVGTLVAHVLEGLLDGAVSPRTADAS